MYHIAAKKILNVFLTERRKLTIEELGLPDLSGLSRKDRSFITVYFEGKLITSTGRVSVMKANTIEEFIDNTLRLLEDTRFKQAMKSPDDISKCEFRVDIIGQENLRIVQNISEINIKKEGIALISQQLLKISVVLPNISNVITKPEELFAVACKKVGIPTDTPTNLFIIYGVSSTVYSQ